MSKQQLDNLRIMWDLIIDVDAEDLDYAKIATYFLIEALKFHDVENIAVKFSGNRGFHIFIPFNSFPSKINNQETKFLFPEGPRIIANYLKHMIKEHLAKKLNTQDPFKLASIDTILISNRHLFRTPYSLHEKSGLVSIPLLPNNILNFKREQALPQNVKTNIKFLDIETREQEAAKFLIQAFDFELKQKKEEKINVHAFAPLSGDISLEMFPPCMQHALNDVREDGKKRTLFLLLSFLRQVNSSNQDMEKILLSWNKKQNKPLQESYIKSQIAWTKNQPLRIPPNCDNPNYYIHPEIAICHPDHFCKKIKNPIQYVKLKQRIFFNQEKKKPKRKLYKSKG